jgi:hypothetical protein
VQGWSNSRILAQRFAQKIQLCEMCVAQLDCMRKNAKASLTTVNKVGIRTVNVHHVPPWEKLQYTQFVKEEKPGAPLTAVPLLHLCCTELCLQRVVFYAVPPLRR